MGHPARHEIEKHAKNEFAVAQERIAVKQAEEQRRVLAQVALRGNIGGYAPALTELKAKHVRQHVIALANAYGKTFTFFGVPCDAEAERSLEAGAQLIAAGSISAIRGELDLIQGRIRRTLHNTGGFHREIEQSTQSAINAGRLRLRRQRIKFKNSGSPLQMGPPAVNRISSATKERTSAVALFNSRPVTIVRGAGTPEELRWETRMGGDFDAKALFQTHDTVVTGDEIHCDVFDQPRVIIRVKPIFASGEVAYREAAIAHRGQFNPQLHGNRPGASESPTPDNGQRSQLPLGRFELTAATAGEIEPMEHVRSTKPSKDPRMPALDFPLPSELTELVPTEVQDEIRFEVLQIHAKLLNRDPEFEGCVDNGKHLQALFNIVASKLSGSRNFDQLLDTGIPAMVAAIRQELDWRWPTGDAEVLKDFFFLGLILEWRLGKRAASSRSSSTMSTRDAKIHEIIGERNFTTLTNAEIMKVRAIRMRLSKEFQLEPREDASKSCLDRIRRAKGYRRHEAFVKPQSETPMWP